MWTCGKPRFWNSQQTTCPRYAPSAPSAGVEPPVNSLIMASAFAWNTSSMMSKRSRAVSLSRRSCLIAAAIFASGVSFAGTAVGAAPRALTRSSTSGHVGFAVNVMKYVGFPHARLSAMLSWYDIIWLRGDPGDVDGSTVRRPPASSIASDVSMSRVAPYDSTRSLSCPALLARKLRRSSSHLMNALTIHSWYRRFARKSESSQPSRW